MRASKSALAVLLVAVVVSSTLAMPAAAGTPAVSASGTTAAPGETVTVTAEIGDAQTAKLGSIPGDWTIESVESAGASTIERDTYVGWAWGADQASQTVSVTLAVPADADPGEYTLDAVVEDSDGNKARSTATATVETTDTTPPVADAGSDISADVDTSVSFDGSGSSDNNAIASYEWDVTGDGEADMTGISPSYTYEEPGTYDVTLTVTDEAGNVDTDTRTVTVEDRTAPTAKAGSDTTAGVGSAVEFDGSGSSDNVGISSYEWDFGDGTTATGATPSHTYDSPGEYTATLTVTDEAGNTETDAITVEVRDTTPPIADAGSDLSVDSGTSVTFDGTASTDNEEIANYEWTFGDGTTATGPHPSHTYDDSGTYEVTLTVTDEAGNEATDTLTVAVEATTTTTEPTTTEADETTTTDSDETTETDESMDGDDETTETTTTTQTAETDQNTETTPGSGDGDGFTLVAAIVGVVATVLVVSRRRL